MRATSGGNGRRLAAIVFADLVNFSGQMATDEDATLARLRRRRDEVLAPLLERHGGRLVKSLGDGFLIEFRSVSAAVHFALDLQAGFAARDRARPERPPMQLRVGIHSGDVLGEGEDIYGDGVNIAARLEQLAPPGGICVSGKVRDEVRGTAPAAFRSLGNRRLKGMPEPTPVFLLAPKEVAGPPASLARFAGPAALSALAALVVAAAVLWQVGPWLDNAVLRGEGRPSLAVAPFAAEATAADDAWFSDGLAEDLITDLSRNSHLFVISRNSSFAAWDEAADLRRYADRLGVTYVVEGSVRRAGDRLRLNVRIVRAETGEAVWAERYDRELSELFDLQAEIARSISGELVARLLSSGAPQPAVARPVSVAAHEAFLQGRLLFRRGTPADNAAAAEAFRRALEIDPGYDRSRTALAKVYVRAATRAQPFADALRIHWSEGLARAWQLLAVAGEADPGRHVVRSVLALRKHQHARAIEEAERALALAPSDPDGLAGLSKALILVGRTEEGRALADRSFEHDPLSAGRARWLKALAAFVDGDVAAARREVERAMEAAPANRADWSGLHAAALGLLGEREAARAAFRTFSRGYISRPSMSWTVAPDAFRNPRFHTWRNVDLAWAVFTHPFRDPRVQERFARGLRAADAPESIGGYIAMHLGSRLSGPEIRKLLWDAEIAGSDFWLSERRWRQSRDAEGEVRHEGVEIHAGPPDRPVAQGRLRGDLLCETWRLEGRPMELCSSLYRVLDPRARLRWGEAVMVTDVGPFPFRRAVSTSE